MAKMGIGIIGSCGWANHYARALAFSEKVRLVAVAGGRRAPVFAERHGVRLEPSPEALCEASDVELVVVATPHGLHADHTVLAAERGRHILVEKPMATSTADCDRVLEACRRAGVKLMVAHSRRFFPLVKLAKQIVDEGRIGRVLMLRQLFCHDARGFGTRPGHWMSDRRLSMGFFIGYGCHQLDMTIHLVGSRVRAVTARFGNYWADTPIENCGALFLDFQSGAYSTFTELCSMPPSLKTWPPFPGFHETNEIVGERGLMLLRPYEKLLLRTSDQWETVLELPKEKADPIEEFLREEVEALADAAANDTEPPVTGAEGRHTVEVIEAAYRSAQTGRSVALPLE